MKPHFFRPNMATRHFAPDRARGCLILHNEVEPGTVGIMPAETEIYNHPILNEQVIAIGGSYVFTAEQILAYQDNQILVYTGHAMMDNSCCGAAGYAYALVPGVIDQYRCQRGAAGRWQSRVRPIREATFRKTIRNLILAQLPVHEVQFL